MSSKYEEDGFLDEAKKGEKKPRKYSVHSKPKKGVKKRSKNRGIKAYDSSSTGFSHLSISEQIRIAAGFDQAVLKVASFGSGKDRALAQIKYISRDFELALSTQDDGKVYTKEEAFSLIETWRDIYFDSRAKSRDTVHLVMSVPYGTCRSSFERSADGFLKEEFSENHEYLYVLHDDTNHPHAHAIICMRGLDSKKLELRKNNINKLRKSYAKHCRDNGIMLDASRRFERGLPGKSVRSEFVQMRRKGVVPERDEVLFNVIKEELSQRKPAADTGKGIRKMMHDSLKKHFHTTAKRLYEEYKSTPESERDDNKIKASKLLYDYSRAMNFVDSREEKLKQKLLADGGFDVGKIRQLDLIVESVFQSKKQSFERDL